MKRNTASLFIAAICALPVLTSIQGCNYFPSSWITTLDWVESNGHWDTTKALLVVMWSQSNGASSGSDTTDLPDSLKGVQPGTKIWVFQANEFQSLNAGVNNFYINEQPGHFGPEQLFGKKMSAYLGVPIYIYKISIAGLPLALDTMPGGQSWNVNQPYLCSYYQYYTEHLQTAINAITATGKTPVLAIGFSMQGESDGVHLEDAQAYLQNRVDFNTQFNADMGLSEFVDIEGRISPYTTHAGFPYIDTVWKAETDFVNCDTANRKLLSTDAYTLNPIDQLHFVSASVLQMGQDLFDLSVPVVKKYFIP